MAYGHLFVAVTLFSLLLHSTQSQLPEITLCSDGYCKPKSTCWSAKEVAVALLKKQCRLADCESSSVTADGIPKASAAMLHRLFAYVDTNGDGLATQSELLAALVSLSSPGSAAVCADLWLRGEEGAGAIRGDEISGVGKRRFAAMLGIIIDRDGSRSDDVTASLEEGSEIQLSAPVGVDLNIHCPLPTVGKAESIQWRRHGISLASKLRVLSRFNGAAADTLVLKDLAPADAGIYQCCSSVWRRLCVTMALSVIDQPRVRVQPPMQVRRVGEPAMLHCRIDGAPVDQLRWLLNSQPLEDRPDLAFIGATTDSGSSLSIAKLGKHHTGLYTCSASNRAGMAESAGSIYVRDATETDYSSYPLSPQIWTAAGPTPTKAVAFHSDGYSILDVTDCSVKRPVSAKLCGCVDSNGLGECDWGSGGDGGSQSQLAAAGRLLYAAQPSQQRLLILHPTGSTKSWFAPESLLVGCRPRLLAYRRPADTVWTACDNGRVLRINRASAVGTAHRPAVSRFGAENVGSRILCLPDSSSDLLVALTEGTFGLVLMVAVSVDDFGEGVGVERARLLVPNAIDRAVVLPQGGTLLLHSSSNASTPLIAVDLVTGRRIPFFSRFFSSNPTGRLAVSERRDRVLHVAGDTMRLFRVLPSGQLALSMHSGLDANPLHPSFQTGPDGTERLLALADWPNGGLLTVTPGESTMRLVFDSRLRGLQRLAVPDFGSLAVAYSTDTAVFVNASGRVPSAAGCPSSLFLGLRAVHWVWPV